MINVTGKIASASTLQKLVLSLNKYCKVKKNDRHVGSDSGEGAYSSIPNNIAPKKNIFNLLGPFKKVSYFNSEFLCTLYY